MKIARIPTAEYASNCYLLISGSEAALVDPSAQCGDICDALEDANAKLKYVILTHGHFDHMFTADDIRDITKAQLCIHSADSKNLTDTRYSLFAMIGQPDMTFKPAEILLEEGIELPLGDEKIVVLHTPGHTEGSVMLDCGEFLVTGDTLFDMSVGRWDFPGGDREVLMRSIYRIYDEYPKATIYAGHGEPSTVQKQIKYNPFTKRR